MWRRCLPPRAACLGLLTAGGRGLRGAIPLASRQDRPAGCRSQPFSRVLQAKAPLCRRRYPCCGATERPDSAPHPTFFTHLLLLQVNKATMNMLQRVEPYVAYGYPNLKTVKVWRGASWRRAGKWRRGIRRRRRRAGAGKRRAGAGRRREGLRGGKVEVGRGGRWCGVMWWAAGVETGCAGGGLVVITWAA